jgi:hypothetical protein
MGDLIRVIIVLIFAVLSLTSCGGDDNSGQLIAPPINVHCAALTPAPSTDTTVAVKCPASQP